MGRQATPTHVAPGDGDASPTVVACDALDAFRDLEAWLASTAPLRVGLDGIERECELKGRELLRRMLQAHLDARGDGDVGDALAVTGPDGPVVLSHKRRHTRRLVTLFGTVTVTRIGYGRPGQTSVHPLDAMLGLPGRCYSYEIQRRLAKTAVNAPFDQAIELVADTTGVVVPKRLAEQIVADAAADFDAFYARREAPSAVQPAGTILVGAIDGKGIPMVKPEPAAKPVRLGKGHKRQKKKMATVGCVFSQQPRIRTPEEVIASLFADPHADDTQVDDETGQGQASRRANRPADKRVWASLLADKDTFIADVRAEMARRDPDHRHDWVIVTDGRRTRTATSRHPHLRTRQHHPRARPAARGREAMDRRLHHPRRGQRRRREVRPPAPVAHPARTDRPGRLRQMVTKRQLESSPRETLLSVAGYLYRNRQRMRYDHYLTNGWPIASGSVEGACKNLVKDRMERSGMRWSPDMAEAMLRLRATHLSGDFEAYWDFHVHEDQKRLYDHDAWTVVRK